MFVTFEGLDGSGKSTQAELLRARLEADGVEVVSTREPGGTELGEKVRDLVLHGGHVAPWAEALLYAAARAAARRRGDQARARAGRGGHLRPLPRLVGRVPGRRARARARARARPEPRRCRRAASRPHVPALARRGGDRAAGCAASTTGSSASRSEFHARAAAGYRELAERFPERIVVLDARRPADELAEEVYGALRVRT